MAWKATTTIGTLVKHKPAAGSFALVEGVQNLTGPGGSKGTTEVQALNDTVKKFKGSRPDYGKMGMDCVFDPADASQLAILAAFNSATPADGDFELGLKDNGAETITFKGFIDEFGISIPNEGPVLFKTGVTLTSAITDAGSPASVTASATFNPIVAQGTVWKLWQTSAYVQIKGVLDSEISGASREKIDATPGDALASSFLPGLLDAGKFTMNLLYDSTEAVHAALKAAYAAENQVDKIEILLTDAAGKKLHFDVVIDGWEYAISKQSTNMCKISGRLNTAVSIV